MRSSPVEQQRRSSHGTSAWPGRPESDRRQKSRVPKINKPQTWVHRLTRAKPTAVGSHPASRNLWKGREETMQKWAPLTVLATIAILLVSSLAAGATTTATANQHPIGGSGIQGSVLFTDNGSTLTVDGTATGLTPHVPYFSLIYTLGSHPGGVSETKTLPRTSNAIAACADLNQAGTSTIDATQMVVGFWKNNNDGTGVLHVVKSAHGNSQEGLWIALGLKSVFESFGVVFGGNSYSPIGNWSTISIRDASNNFALVACGE